MVRRNSFGADLRRDVVEALVGGALRPSLALSAHKSPILDLSGFGG
jgi:hypothetical protein